MDPSIKLALQTIKENKQAIVFCSSRASAEKTAEDIAKQLKKQNNSINNTELADKASKVVSPPTKQCKRLALCLTQNIAFHHSGLAAKQKAIVEDTFRDRKISIICSTPSLAIGLSLPVFRVILKSLKDIAPGLVWTGSLF